jgi:hypothetical protein
MIAEALGMQTRWRATTTVLFTAFLGIGTAGPALAQPAGEVTQAKKDAARADYKAAEAKFAAGDYRGALPLYEAAEAIVPIPQTKYKIAACKDKLGQMTDAMRYYQLFLSSVPPEKQEKLAVDMADARARLAALQRTPAQVRVVATPNPARLLVSIDGGPAQPVTPTLSLPPGHHRLAFQAEGFDPVTTELDLGPADGKEVQLKLTKGGAGAVAGAPGAGPVGAPPPGSPAEYPARRRSDVPAYVLIGVAGAGIVVASVFGGLAISDKSNFNRHPTNANADTTHTHAEISDIAFGVSGAIGITGIILLLTNLPKSSATGSVYVTPYAGPTGAGATGGFAF